MPQTGPITETGKRKSSLNSLKHGLNSPGLMSCKKAGCFFWDICSCRNTTGTLDINVDSGSACPIETFYYSWVLDRYGRAIGQEQNENKSEDLHQLALAEVRLRRACQALALYPEPSRLIPGPIPGYKRPAQSLFVRYKLEAQQHWHECIARLFPKYTLPRAWDDEP